MKYCKFKSLGFLIGLTVLLSSCTNTSSTPQNFTSIAASSSPVEITPATSVGSNCAPIIDAIKNELAIQGYYENENNLRSPDIALALQDFELFLSDMNSEEEAEDRLYQQKETIPNPRVPKDQDKLDDEVLHKNIIEKLEKLGLYTPGDEILTPAAKEAIAEFTKKGISTSGTSDSTTNENNDLNLISP